LSVSSHSQSVYQFLVLLVSLWLVSWHVQESTVGQTVTFDRQCFPRHANWPTVDWPKLTNNL